jgi:hypothetical protein
MVKYALEGQITLYNTYAQNKSYIMYGKVSLQAVWCPNYSYLCDFQISKESAFNWVFLKQNAVQTKKLHEVGGRLEHSPCTSLTQLAQQTWDLMTKV